ncbi:hypothetical protein MJ_ECL18 (plasmid) [Methanocaldococcus jannaschii DSM 2661]|uniref:Uncharacterized protein MJECL18 n=2 Tax=Methanocaldococcus jannaschii TaxID=2190 RepID=Y3518_METJA|nr:RecName: Full=Uncharacterized protein MJECL18 [Methanocaldococcus jannaschii DSM 2661]AAC37089.1 hypothetical protein MJ_ECL18 [Methanocaldococcus jannaschii DSM 2661]
MIFMFHSGAMELLKIAEKLYDKDSEKAVEVYDKAIKKAERIYDDYAKAVILSNIAKSLYSRGLTNKVIEVYNKAIKIAEESSKRDVILSKIIENLCSNRLIDKALEVVNKISDDSSKAIALSEIAKAQYNIGMHDEALKNYDKAIFITEGVFDDEIKSSILFEISRDFYNYGLVDKAFEVIGKIPYSKYRFRLLDKMAEDLHKNIKYIHGE